MVLHHAGAQAEPIVVRRDLWAVKLCEALAANEYFFRQSPNNWPRSPHEMAASGAFEIEPQHRVALWYGGFVEAGARTEAISSWLLRGPDSVLEPLAERG